MTESQLRRTLWHLRAPPLDHLIGRWGHAGEARLLLCNGGVAWEADIGAWRVLLDFIRLEFAWQAASGLLDPRELDRLAEKIYGGPVDFDPLFLGGFCPLPRPATTIT